MIGRNNVIYMAARRAIPISAGENPPCGTGAGPAQLHREMQQRLHADRNDPDAWAAALHSMYELLDAMVAWRVSFANGTEGDKALSAIGRAKVLEVRTTSIHNIKSAIEDAERQRPEH